MNEPGSARQRAQRLLDQLRDDELESAVAVLQGLVDGRDAPSGAFGGFLGLRSESQSEGRASFRIEARPHLFNPNGVLHGGALFAAMDTSMGGALTSVLDEGELCATVEAKIHYLLPVTGGTVVAESEVVHKGGRMAVLESRARTEAGRLAALMTGTFFIIR